MADDDFAAQMALFEAEVGSLAAAAEEPSTEGEAAQAPAVAEGLARPTAPPPGTAVARPAPPPPGVARPVGPPPSMVRPAGPPPGAGAPPPGTSRPAGSPSPAAVARPPGPSPSAVVARPAVPPPSTTVSRPAGPSATIARPAEPAGVAWPTGLPASVPAQGPLTAGPGPGPGPSAPPAQPPFHPNYPPGMPPSMPPPMMGGPIGAPPLGPFHHPPPQQYDPYNQYSDYQNQGYNMPPASLHASGYAAGPQLPYQPPQLAGGSAQEGILAEALAGVKRALAGGNPQETGGGEDGAEKEAKKKKVIYRTAAGERWRDDTLAEWPENDHRIFVGDLGNEVNDDSLTKAFSKYPSFAKAKVVKDARTKKSKGFGFVSFLDATDFAKAMREMDGKYIGNRPCKLRRSDWQKREMNVGKRDPKAVGKGGKTNKRHVNHL